MHLFKRKKIAIAIIIVGVFASYLIIAPKHGNGGFALNVGLENNVKSSIDYQKDAQEVSNNSGQPETNLTQTFLNQYALTLVQKNPDGPLNVNGEKMVTIPSGATIETIIEEAIGKGIQIEATKESDIRQIDDSSEKAVIEYLAAIRSANANISSETDADITRAVYQLVQNNDPSFLTEYSDGINSLITSLLAIPTPSSWKSFHLSLLNYQQKKLAIAKAVLNIGTDPIMALAAIDTLNELNNDEETIARLLKEKLDSTIK